MDKSKLKNFLANKMPPAAKIVLIYLVNVKDSVSLHEMSTEVGLEYVEAKGCLAYFKQRKRLFQTMHYSISVENDTIHMLMMSEDAPEAQDPPKSMQSSKAVPQLKKVKAEKKDG